MRLIVFSLLALLGSCLAAEITVDPSGPTLEPGLGITIPANSDNAWITTTSTWTGTEWNSDGNLESWSPLAMGTPSVSSGILTATSTSNDPRISRSSISGGPDLDLGWNDFIEFRLQLPANYSGDIELFYGVANAGVAGQTGISSSRMVTVPNSVIPKDGAFHVYRIDMALETPWRGKLNDLRIDPATQSNITFSLDYIRVGDVPGNDYAARISKTCPAHGAVKDIDGRVHTIRSMESKRFRIIYSNLTLAEDPGVPWSDTKARGTLRNLEEAWQVFVKKHGYREPCYPIGATSGDIKYKSNMTMIYLGGTWAGGDDGGVSGGPAYGYQNTYPAATDVDPPSLVTPHEFMHVCQMHQEGGYRNNPPMGKWWEAHANYGREIYLAHYTNLFPGRSELADSFPYSSFLFHTHGRHYYDCWPLFLYLDENPDNLSGLGNEFTRRLWRESLQGEYLYSSIARLAPAASVKDVIGGYARRSVTWDYSASRKSAMQAKAATWDQEWLSRYQFAPAVKRVDDPSWWRVPSHLAPQAFAYTVHPLTPIGTGAGRVVSVNFRGIQDPARQSDWRASLVVVNDSGVTRYSPLWSSGNQSVTLASNENTVYLSVAATPGEILGTLHWDPDQPYQSHPAKTRFPYEFQVTGASPKDAGTGSTTLVTHANGGGKKASTATVASTAYIGPNARVLDYAVVKENARVEDNAIVSGRALLRGNAIARGNAKVREHAMMQTNTIAEGNARVGGHAWLMETARVTDNATIKGAAQVYGSGVVSGDAVLDGDSVTGANVSNGFQFGWGWGGQAPDVIASRTAPARLFSSYEFSSAHPYTAKDKYGVTDAPLVGSPIWWSSDGIRNGYLAFNGSGQYSILNRWQNDFPEITITTWVSWGGGPNNQPVFHFGDGTTAKQLYLTPKNNAGVCELKITSGGNTYSIAASSALQVGRWTRVGVLINGTTASLYLDGALAGSVACPVRPQDLLPADTTETPAHNCLARGTGLPDFNGSIDDFNVYSLATTSVLDPSTLTGDLLAWYKFDEASGTSANDSSVNNSDATLVNGPTWNSGALSFDGINDDVQTPVANGSARTLAAWIYPRSSDSVANIESVFDCDVPGQYGTGWGLNNGTIRVILDDRFWNTGVPITLNQWQHVALAFNAVQARVYVDGVLRATLDYSQGAVTAANFRIGRSNANELFFHGDIHDAKIYSRAVNDLEILEVINGSSPAPDLAPQNPTATAGEGGVTISWDPANDGETWYAVRRSTTSGGPYSPISGAVTGTTFTDTNVTPGTTYHYVIIAVNSSGNGPESAEASATPALPPGNGNWTSLTHGAWSLSANWQDAIIAGGTDNTATFAQGNGVTVTLDTDRTLGGLSFANSNYLINGPGTLTLDTASGAPVIAVASGISAGIGANMEGSDGLSKTGAGTLTLSGNNSYSGATTVNEGTLSIQSPLSSTSHVIAAGAVLDLSRASNIDYPSGTTFSGAGTLRKTGAGEVIWGLSAVSFSLASGALIDVQAGTFVGGSYANENWSGNQSDLNVAAGSVFKTVEANVRLNRITGSGTLGTGYAGAGYEKLTIGIGGGSSTFSGSITNTDHNPSWHGSLAKEGAGTITLAGTNTYTGATAVNDGTLLVNGSINSTATVTVANTANLGGTGTINGPITVNANATLAPGASIGTLTAASAAISGKLAIEVNETAADRLNATGNLNITNATLAITGTLSAEEYLIASYGSLSGSAFASITGLPAGYDVDYSNNQIRLIANPTFGSWMEDNHPSLSDKTPTGDSDNDGLDNAVEYVLGGDLSQPDTGRAPTLTAGGGNLLFTFQRSEVSKTDDITLMVEAGPDLTSWPDTYHISPGTPSAGVSIQENGASPDTITVTIPQSGNAKFARLKVLVNP